MEPKQKTIQPPTKAEKDTITAHFKDNDILLKSLRALFLGLPISDEEKTAIRALPQNIKAIIWDRFLPQMSKDSEIGILKDVWLGAEQMVFGQPDHVVYQAIEYKHRAVEMTRKALMLMNDEGPAINLEYSIDLYPNDRREFGVALLARNQFIRHVEDQLFALKVIANIKDPTPKEVAKKQEQDSSQ